MHRLLTCCLPLHRGRSARSTLISDEEHLEGAPPAATPADAEGLQPRQDSEPHDPTPINISQDCGEAAAAASTAPVRLQSGYTLPAWHPSPALSWSQPGQEQSSVVDALLEGVRGLLHSDGGATTTFTNTGTTASESTLLSIPAAFASPAASIMYTPGGSIICLETPQAAGSDQGGCAATILSTCSSIKSRMSAYGIPAGSLPPPALATAPVAAASAGAGAIASRPASGTAPMVHRRRPSPLPPKEPSNTISNTSIRYLQFAGANGSVGSAGRPASGSRPASASRLSSSSYYPPCAGAPTATAPPAAAAAAAPPPSLALPLGFRMSQNPFDEVRALLPPLAVAPPPRRTSCPSSHGSGALAGRDSASGRVAEEALRASGSICGAASAATGLAPSPLQWQPTWQPYAGPVAGTAPLRRSSTSGGGRRHSRTSSAGERSSLGRTMALGRTIALVPARVTAVSVHDADRDGAVLSYGVTPGSGPSVRPVLSAGPAAPSVAVGARGWASTSLTAVRGAAAPEPPAAAAAVTTADTRTAHAGPADTAAVAAQLAVTAVSVRQVACMAGGSAGGAAGSAAAPASGDSVFVTAQSLTSVVLAVAGGAAGDGDGGGEDTAAHGGQGALPCPDLDCGAGQGGLWLSGKAVGLGEGGSVSRSLAGAETSGSNGPSTAALGGTADDGFGRAVAAAEAGGGGGGGGGGGKRSRTRASAAPSGATVRNADGTCSAGGTNSTTRTGVTGSQASGGSVAGVLPRGALGPSPTPSSNTYHVRWRRPQTPLLPLLSYPSSSASASEQSAQRVLQPGAAAHQNTRGLSGQLASLLADITGAVQPLPQGPGGGRSSILIGFWRGMPVAVKLLCSPMLAHDGPAVTAARRAGATAHRHLVASFGIRTAPVDQVSAWTLVPEPRRSARAFAQSLALTERPYPSTHHHHHHLAEPPAAATAVATPAAVSRSPSPSLACTSAATSDGAYGRVTSSTTAVTALLTPHRPPTASPVESAYATPASGSPPEADDRREDPGPGHPVTPRQQQQPLGQQQQPPQPSQQLCQQKHLSQQQADESERPQKPPPLAAAAAAAAAAATGQAEASHDASGSASGGGVTLATEAAAKARPVAVPPGCRPKTPPPAAAAVVRQAVRHPSPPHAVAAPWMAPQSTLGRQLPSSPRRTALAALRPQPGDHVAVLIMSYCELGDLGTIMARPYNPFRPSRRWPPYLATRALLRCAREVAAALTLLHRRGLVHGGVKPSNVLLVPSRCDMRRFEVKLSDACFSSTSLVDGNGSGPLAASNGLLYYAPEALRLGPSRSADVWAFGLLLLAMVTAPESLFAGEPVVPMLLRIAETAYRPPWPSPCPTGQHGALLQPLYERCTRADPEERPTFEQIYVDLRALEEQIRTAKRYNTIAVASVPPPLAAGAAASSAAMVAAAALPPTKDFPPPTSGGGRGRGAAASATSPPPGSSLHSSPSSVWSGDYSAPLPSQLQQSPPPTQ